MTDFLQQFVIGIVFGSRIGLIGVSFALIIGVTQRFHVAYTATYVGGVYAGYWAYNDIGLPMGLSVVIGLLFAGVFGALIEATVYRRIAARAARRGTDQLIPIFIAALGVTILVQNLISWIWNTQPLAFDVIPLSPITWGDIYLTNLDVLTVIASWVAVIALAAFLRYTRLGSSVGAVRVNADMARVVGVNPARIFVLVFFVGSVMSAVLGMLEANGTGADPSMGLTPVFYGFVVAFVAGLDRSPIRMAVVGLVIGLVQSLSALWISIQYGPAVVFTILLVYLILLPTNFRRIVAIRRRGAVTVA